MCRLPTDAHCRVFDSSHPRWHRLSQYDEDGRLDPRAVHCAKPVTKGEKWAANNWVALTPEELLTEVKVPTF